MREATLFTHRLSADAKVSIHASHAGGDAICIASRIHSAVSIHASHAGGDLVVDNHCGVHNCFNPRLPCGRRPDWCLTVMRSKKFQSTPPMREATRPGQLDGDLRPVSIHASHAGGDKAIGRASAAIACFNPRLPCGRRLAGDRGHIGYGKVSIHASHAGGDQPVVILSNMELRFNPRLPCGRRHGRRADQHHASRFNPRLPCGRRPSSMLCTMLFAMFQSTPPMREATWAE